MSEDRSIPLFPEALAEMKKLCESQQYCPSNGTEGEMFMSNWCYQCANWQECDFGYMCPIQSRSMFGNVEEWIYDQHGQPKCIKFTEEGNEPCG